MTKRQSKQGKRGETIARHELEKIGVKKIEKVGTPFTITETRKIGRKIFYAGFFGEKVAADWIGTTSSGVGVLCEVKTTHNKNLTYSALRKHQPEKLSEYLGIALLVWVHETEWSQDVYVMRWHDCVKAGFKPRSSITPEMAKELHITTI
ncbi:MAG: hypothetical protein GY755_16945 [Chloroflexi bacterium]|nr:hypothetical protein [Chloroflexota bacterium]